MPLQWQQFKDAPPSSASNPWFAVSMGLLGIIVGFMAGTWRGTPASLIGGTPPPAVQAPPAEPPPPPSSDTPATPDDDPVLGKADAPVTLIEFTDYQCPFCDRFFSQTLPSIKKEYIDTGKVKLVMRDFPLSFHQHAAKAAEATECADDQGKFWEMHDLLFRKQGEWSNAANGPALFKKYAAELGLNASSFTTCLDDGTYEGETQKDMADGSAAGIGGTPGFWVLGPGGQSRKIEGAVPFAQFKSIIEGMLGGS